VAEFLFSIAVFLMLVIGVGLARLVYGPSAADRLMAVQLLGTGVGAVCLLLADATENNTIVDVALTLAFLAAFAVAAFGSSSISGTEAGDHKP
jgi:multicomponent Na+:H+ antiporter subunit F